MKFEINANTTLSLSQLYHQELSAQKQPIFKFDPSFSDRRSTLLRSENLQLSQQFQQLHFPSDDYIVSLFYLAGTIGVAYKIKDEVIIQTINQSQISSIRQFIINQEINNVSIVHNPSFPQNLLTQVKSLLSGITIKRVTPHEDYDWHSKVQNHQEILNLASIDTNALIQIQAALPVWDLINEPSILKQISESETDSKLKVNQHLQKHLCITKHQKTSQSIEQLFEKFMNFAYSKQLLKQQLQHPISSYSQLARRYSTLQQIYQFQLQPSNLKLIKLLSKVGSISLLFKILTAYPDKTEPYQKLYQQLQTLTEFTSQVHQMHLLERKTQVFTCPLFKDILALNNAKLNELLEYMEGKLQFNQASIQIKEGNFPALDQMQRLEEQFKNEQQYVLKKHQQELSIIGVKQKLQIEYQQQFVVVLKVEQSFILDGIGSQLGWRLIRSYQQGAVFVTDLTQSLDQKYGNVNDRLIQARQRSIIQIVQKILSYQELLAQYEQRLGSLDYYLGLGSAMTQLKLVMPSLNTQDYVSIKGGRHLLVESNTQKFQQNDFVAKEHRVFLIVGPNYSGKSIYIRQVGVIVYLAHCGLPVPAESADICVFSQMQTLFPCESNNENNLSVVNNELIDLGEGLKVEGKSLVLMDEVGKNFKYQMGSNLHKSTIEFFQSMQPLGPIVLSATHYQHHDISGVMKGEMEVVFEQTRNLLFVYRINFRKGYDQHKSYGLEVALSIHQNEELYQQGVELYNKLTKYKQLLE